MKKKNIQKGMDIVTHLKRARAIMIFRFLVKHKKILIVLYFLKVVVCVFFLKTWKMTWADRVTV